MPSNISSHTNRAPSRRTFLLAMPKLAGALAASLLLPGLLGGCSKNEPRLQAVPTGATVLAFGDSVTYGTGAQSGQDWPSLLAGMTGWNVVNAGIPGDTAAQGKDRLAALLNTHAPKLLIIEIGGNDFLHRSPASTVKANVRHMLATARAAGVQTVLVAVPELSVLGLVTKKPSDSPLYAELGKEEKVPVIADVFSEVLGTESLRADPIHPNATGYRQMAEKIHDALRKYGA